MMIRSILRRKAQVWFVKDCVHRLCIEMADDGSFSAAPAGTRAGSPTSRGQAPRLLKDKFPDFSRTGFAGVRDHLGALLRMSSEGEPGPFGGMGPVTAWRKENARVPTAHRSPVSPSLPVSLWRSQTLLASRSDRAERSPSGLCTWPFPLPCQNALLVLYFNSKCSRTYMRFEASTQ